MWLYPGGEDSRTRRMVVLLAAALLGVDAWMFYKALGQMGWSGEGGSSNEVVATLGWAMAGGQVLRPDTSTADTREPPLGRTLPGQSGRRISLDPG